MKDVADEVEALMEEVETLSDTQPEPQCQLLRLYVHIQALLSFYGVAIVFMRLNEACCRWIIRRLGQTHY